jgi:hypothetical protein
MKTGMNESAVAKAMTDREGRMQNEEWRTPALIRFRRDGRADGKKINGAHGVVHTAALETGSLLTTTTRNAKRAQSKSGLVGILFLIQRGGKQ